MRLREDDLNSPIRFTFLMHWILEKETLIAVYY